MIKSCGFREPSYCQVDKEIFLITHFYLAKKVASTAKSLWKLPLKPAAKLGKRCLGLRYFGKISCTWKILLSIHCNQVKAKQAGVVACYWEKWAEKVSVRKLFPKTLPVHRETRASHKTVLGLDYLGDLLQSLECQITREGEPLARLWSESSQDRCCSQEVMSICPSECKEVSSNFSVFQQH